MTELKWDVKAWGETRCLINTSLYSQHELMLNEGGFCSFHYHVGRANRFFLKAGMVRLVWCYGWEIHSVVLMPENNFDIPSRVPHQFQVLKTGRMIEEYYPDRGGKVQNDDIIRLTKGNKIDDIDHIQDTVGILKEDGSFWEVSD